MTNHRLQINEIHELNAHAHCIEVAECCEKANASSPRDTPHTSWTIVFDINPKWFNQCHFTNITIFNHCAILRGTRSNIQRIHTFNFINNSVGVSIFFPCICIRVLFVFWVILTHCNIEWLQSPNGHAFIITLCTDLK